MSATKPCVVEYVPFPLTLTMFVNRGLPWQRPWSGSQSWKVMVPVGLAPPVSAAESLSVTPFVPLVGFGVVEKLVWHLTMMVIGPELLLP
ncbi:MAG: hypothetical protein E6K68_06285 [Nitrospirae bacterium]|nr:MAG: hypothetical protein E6K68_06285 [Nitrospirota bacterium]